MINDLWWFNEESEQVVNRGYLLKGETIHDAIERICDAASKRLFRPELKEPFRELIVKGWMSWSSPIWANMGTSRGLPISCFNVHVPDSVEGITGKLGEVMMQTKIGGGTSGYFGELRHRGSAVTDNGKSSGAVSFMKLFDTAMDVVSQGACYQEGTKVLTNNGFKDFRDIQLGIDSIAQVDQFNNISFTEIYELTNKNYEGNLIKIKGKKKDSLVDIGVTPNHRMVIERMKGSSRNNTKHWSGNTEIILAKDLKLHRDNRLYISGNTDIESNSLSDEERLMIAFQADGRKNWKSDTMLFRFKKTRKIDRLTNLLNKMNLNYVSRYRHEDKSTTFYIYDVKNLKKETLSWIDISKISLSWCKEFLEEISEWDSYKRTKTSFDYSSIIESNVLKVQEISVLCGKRSRLINYLNREGKRKDLYSISISEINTIGGDACDIYEEYYNGKVYCAIVPQGRLIVSHNGRTLICGNTRRGAFAAYLDIDHQDIEEFLQIKDIGSPIQNLFNGVCVPDYWMQDMIDGDADKRKIWAKVLESRQKKGLPYIMFTDNANKNKPQVYKDLGLSINASNLCSEIMLPSSAKESFICCLASMNLALYDEWKDTDAVKTAIYFLDAVLSEFIAKTEDNFYLKEAHNFAKRHRAVGLGVLGWHSYLQSKMLPFGSMMSKMLNKQIFAQIQKQSKEASKELAEIYGPAPIYLEGQKHEEYYRNTTTMAIAPTTSSSAILGQVSPGIEPYMSNFFKAGLAKGNFIRKNKYLQKLLESKGIDNEDTWRIIMRNHGSVQELPELSDEEKLVFRTFKETSQADIIDQAGDRQQYIDQSQSLNLMIPSTLPVKDVNNLYITAWEKGVKTLYYQRSTSVSKEELSNIVACGPCSA